MTSEDYLKEFRDVIEKMYKLTEAKNHDYAREEEALANFKEFGSIGVLIRLSDKFQRIKNVLWFRRGLVVNDESIEDTMFDQAVYSVILYILYRKEKADKKLANTVTRVKVR